jgi:hypothetical protein
MDSVHSATHHTPFYLNYGQHLCRGDEVKKEARNETVEEFVEGLEKTRKDAQSALENTADHVKKAHDQHA